MNLFSLRMAWRETRAAWRHFLYFFVCIALGVGALVGVGLFAANVERAVTTEARGLMAGDLEVRLARRMSQAGEAVLRSLADRGIATTHVSELVAMAAATTGWALQPSTQQATQIIELKAVGEGYPFYGALKVEPDQPLAELLSPPAPVCQALSPSDLSPHVSRFTPHASCYGAVVQESLLIRMGLKVGDRIKIGEAPFVITGILRKESDRVAGAFSLGPRVMISHEGLAAADLVKLGSRVRERYLLRVPPTIPVEPLLHELRGRLASESARVIGYRDAQPQLRRFLDQLTRYLGLIGLTALFVGGIGVAGTIQAFLREKLNTIAILKTLGADSVTIVRTYLIQALLLGVIGSLAGAALGIGLQAFLPRFLTALLPMDVIDLPTSLAVSSLVPILKGTAMGVLTTLLFTLWPLLGIRGIRPALIFRRDVAGAAPASVFHLSWLRAQMLTLRSLTAFSMTAGLAGLAIWQAGSWRIGLIFIGGLVAAVILLLLATLGLTRALRFIPGPRSLAIRHAIGNLHRPGSQAAGIMVSVGIGVMVIVSVSILERSLVTQLGESRPVDAPTFFFIDIQPDQKEAFLQLIRQRMPEANPETTPLIRSRLYTLNGKPVEAGEGDKEQGKREGEEGAGQETRQGWYRTREYVLTVLQDLPKDNVIVKGAWWDPQKISRKPLVSVEEDAAGNLGLVLGSTVEFDIQGATVSAEVSSIRKVEWGNFSTNFYMILSPGSLKGAPFTYVATVRVPPESEVPLQQAVVATFPNITAINIGDVLESFTRVLERLSLAIRAIALFCILTGGIVMAAALATTRYRRLYESVVLKAL
ncbi:MAG: ABC transporter permease [Nitrospirae bacterium]|nr:ABC transporter permease [Nitrospirota bacterium]